MKSFEDLLQDPLLYKLLKLEKASKILIPLGILLVILLTKYIFLFFVGTWSHTTLPHLLCYKCHDTFPCRIMRGKVMCITLPSLTCSEFIPFSCLVSWNVDMLKTSLDPWVRTMPKGMVESQGTWSEVAHRVWLFMTPWSVAYQAPPYMGFSRQEDWSGLPFPSPGDLPNPGIEPGSPTL